MRGIFLAASILIHAPVYADQARGSSEFLKEYKAFAEKRNLQNQSAHNARFQGVLKFRLKPEAYDKKGSRGIWTSSPSGSANGA